MAVSVVMLAAVAWVAIPVVVKLLPMVLTVMPVVAAMVVLVASVMTRPRIPMRWPVPMVAMAVSVVTPVWVVSRLMGLTGRCRVRPVSVATAVVAAPARPATLAVPGLSMAPVVAPGARAATAVWVG